MAPKLLRREGTESRATSDRRTHRDDLTRDDPVGASRHARRRGRSAAPRHARARRGARARAGADLRGLVRHHGRRSRIPRLRAGRDRPRSHDREPVPRRQLRAARRAAHARRRVRVDLRARSGQRGGHRRAAERQPRGLRGVGGDPLALHAGGYAGRNDLAPRELAVAERRRVRAGDRRLLPVRRRGRSREHPPRVGRRHAARVDPHASLRDARARGCRLRSRERPSLLRLGRHGSALPHHDRGNPGRLLEPRGAEWLRGPRGRVLRRRERDRLGRVRQRRAGGALHPARARRRPARPGRRGLARPPRRDALS
jgi:hypothetical protein